MVAVISGCATISNWTPTVDATVDPKTAQLTADMKDCKVLAENAAGAFDLDRVFKNAYKACLKGRNHPVL